MASPIRPSATVRAKVLAAPADVSVGAAPGSDASPPARGRLSILIDLQFPLAEVEARAPPGALAVALAWLAGQGIKLLACGEHTLVLSGDEQAFAAAFASTVEFRRLDDPCQYSSVCEPIMSVAPSWEKTEALRAIVASVTLERPHVYLAGNPQRLPLQATPARPWSGLTPAFQAVSSTPPRLVGFTALDVLVDVPRLLGARDAHAKGHCGKGVRVAMIDTGFAHGHPFFVDNGFRSTVQLARMLDAAVDATDVDRRGHGTAESANLFAVAPCVEMLGIKLTPDNPDEDDCPLLGPFLDAVALQPDIISISIAYDLCDRQRVQDRSLRADLVPLANEIKAAVAKGIVVVAGAGNGQYAFPAQMPEVIAAGGVHADDPRLSDPAANGQVSLAASDYASAFVSEIYGSRKVPDCCGLVGRGPDGRYIMLPLPPLSDENVAFARGIGPGMPGDLTTPDDGWAVLSGTSAAAPQIAGVCALMLGANRALTPVDVKRILRETARPVTQGSANPLSASPPGLALIGTDATGAGLVDASAAVEQAIRERPAAPPSPGSA